MHGTYEAFYVNDPKRRHIHKAAVVDRLVHQVLYSALYPVFDPLFIYDSYSCRLTKGTHRAVLRLQTFLRKESHNYTQECYALKCDIKKFFASVDTGILLDLIKKKVKDERTLWLIRQVLQSFRSGLPLGNLTSQLFANVYLNELDQFVKHTLKIKYYIRYADDFIIICKKHSIYHYIDIVKQFLWEKQRLTLHEQKIIVRKFSWGIDFLGYIILPHFSLPRTKTKKRLLTKIQQKRDLLERGEITRESFNQTVQSYLGYLGHANAYKLRTKIEAQLG